MRAEDVQYVSEFHRAFKYALTFYCRGLLKALAFTQSGVYVNTARVDPSKLYIDNQRLYLSDKKCLAVGLMTGTVTESFLVASTEAGRRSAQFQVHKLTIAPFEQEWRRDASMWGLLFKFTETSVIYGTNSSQGFSFTTRGEGKGDSSRSREYTSTRLITSSIYRIPFSLYAFVSHQTSRGPQA
jgi:hypothetical protein